LRAKESPFVIGLREISPSGLHKDWDLGGDFARAVLVDTEADGDSAHLRAGADLTRSGVEVLARGRIAGEVTMVCSRCAGDAHVVLDGPFEVLFLPRDADAPAGDEAQAGEEPDVAVYDDDAIDLEETLREEILVALPFAPVCRESCMGLCPTCGKDLNEGPCNCQSEPRDERLGALRNLKID
jgi:uncharacterized protein